MINPYKLLARAPEVTLEFTRLPDNEMGRWVPQAQTILLDDRLSQAERRCTLMHELLHRVLDLDGQQCHQAQERQCVQSTAELLIPLPRLLDALMWSLEEHIEEIAEQLWVDTDTVWDRIEHLSGTERDYLIHRLQTARPDQEQTA